MNKYWIRIQKKRIIRIIAIGAKNGNMLTTAPIIMEHMIIFLSIDAAVIRKKIA